MATDHWRSSIVTRGDVALAVREAGDPRDPTVVLVHGYPDTSAVWDEVATALAASHHVVLYDVRGAGASTRCRRRRDFRMAELVADLSAVIDATAADRPVHLVGHDWGSVQSWEAVTDPAFGTRLASYTTISGPCLDHAGFWFRRRVRRPTPRHLRQIAGQAVRSTYVAVFQLPVLPALFWRAGGAPLFRRFLRRVEGVPTDGSYPAPTLAADGRAGVNLYRANMAPRLGRPRRRPTTLPVQLIVPTRERYVSPALLADLAEWAPDLRRHEVAAGHWVVRTHPGEVARLVAAHVAAHTVSDAARRTVV